MKIHNFWYFGKKIGAHVDQSAQKQINANYLVHICAKRCGTYIQRVVLTLKDSEGVNAIGCKTIGMEDVISRGSIFVKRSTSGGSTYTT